MMQVEGQVKSSQVELTRKDNEISELKVSFCGLWIETEPFLLPNSNTILIK